MIRNIELLLFLFVVGSACCFSQNDNIKTPRLSQKQNEIGYYNVDGLNFTIDQQGGIVLWSFGNKRGDIKVVPLQLQDSFKFKEEEIIKCKDNKDTTFIETQIVIVLDSLILIEKEEKKINLSSVDQSKIISIERVEEDEAVKQYGELSKKGVVKVRTK